MDSTDRQNLFAIAMLTPYVGGEGVYTTRAMLGIDPEDYNLPYRKGRPQDSIDVSGEEEVNVYPNPANSIITFETNCESVYYIEIYDIYGKQIGNYSSHKKLIDLDISSVCFYKVYGQMGIIKSGKFIKL